MKTRCYVIVHATAFFLLHCMCPIGCSRLNLMKFSERLSYALLNLLSGFCFLVH